MRFHHTPAESVKTNTTATIPKRAAAAFFAVLLFLALALPRFNTLMGQDEISHYYKLIRLLFENGYSSPDELIVFSPHGYPLIALTVCRILGQCSPAAIRITGILMWIVCICIMARRSPLSAVMLACIPAVCQAAMTVEIDQTALPLACLFLVFASEKLAEKPTPGTWISTALAMAFALWCRLTTPALICIPLLIASPFASDANFWRKRLPLFTAMAAGLLLFIITWYAYCRFTGITFIGPFTYLIRSFGETTVGERSGGFARAAYSTACLCIWGFNPFLAILFLRDGWRRLTLFKQNRCFAKGDAIWLSAAAILLGYTFVGGALFGFPKYQCPALPLACLAIALGIHSQKPNPSSINPTLIFALGTALITFFIFQDPLFAMRATIREHILENISAKPVILNMALRCLVTYILIAALILFVKKALPPEILLLIAAISVNTAFSIRQNTAPYSTGYIYGDKGETARLAQIIDANKWQNHLLFVPVEAVHLLGFYDTKGLPPAQWNDCGTLAHRIATEKPAVIAASILINPMGQMRQIRNTPELANVLDANYIHNKDNAMHVWIRKPQ